MAAAAVTAFLLVPRHDDPDSSMAYPAYEVAVREIGTALIEYNTTHGTDTAPYPSDIRQLDGMGITSNIDKLLSVHPEDAGDWLYFWAADSENPSAPLLISPALGDERPGHILLTVDGAVRIVDPAFVAEAARSSLEPPYKVHAPLIK